MLLNPRSAVLLHTRADLRGSDLSQLVWQRDDLVAGVFDGARLVRGDVPAIRRNNTFPGAQPVGDDGGVGLGSTDHEMHLGIRRLAGGAQGIGGRGAQLIGPIAGMHAAHLRDGFQNAGVG